MLGLTHFPIDDSNRYVHHRDHRNGNRQKSQWSIQETEERESFRQTLAAGWVDGTEAWGLYVVETKAQYLGISADEKHRCYIAKFKDGNANKVWHGYPVENNREPADIPVERIQADWIKKKLVRERAVRMMAKGQPCVL